jgi:hypothetical protein
MGVVSVQGDSMSQKKAGDSLFTRLKWNGWRPVTKFSTIPRWSKTFWNSAARRTIPLGQVSQAANVRGMLILRWLT